MLRHTLSNIKKVCAFTFLPRIWRGHIVKCSPAKFQKLPNHLSSAGKSSKSSDKGDCEKCKRIIEYAFGSGQYPTSDIKGFPKLIDTELANIVSPQIEKKSKDPKKILEKQKTEENDQTKEPLSDVGVINSSKIDESVLDEVKKVPKKVDNLPASENLVLATTAKRDKEDLTQAIEKPESKKNDKAKETLVDFGVINSSKIDENMVVDGIKKVSTKADNSPATENLVFATTAKRDKEDLTQKIEKPEEPSLVEPTDNSKQDLPDSVPKVLTNKLKNELENTVKTTNINDTTKVQTMNVFMTRSPESQKRKLNAISASTKSKAQDLRSSVDEEKSKIGGDNLIQPSLKSLDNNPNADTDIAKAHISTFQLKSKVIKREAEKVPNEPVTLDGNLPDGVQGVEKKPILEQNKPVDEGKKEQEWWKQRRDHTFMNFTCNKQKGFQRSPTGPFAATNIAKPVANTRPLSENNNETLSNPMTSKDEKIHPVLLNALKTTDPTGPGDPFQHISNQTVPNSTSKTEYPNITDINISEKANSISLSYFSSTNKSKESTISKKPKLLELDAEIPNDPVKYSAYPFPSVPDSTTSDCIKCEAVDRTNKITLVPTIDDETVKAEVDVSFKYEHPIMAIETTRCDPVYGCKPSYTEANPDENSTNYRDSIEMPEKLNVNEVSNASHWASPEQQTRENPSPINPPWKQSGNQQYNTPQWAAYTNLNWSKSNSAWNEYPDWYEAQQQLDYARWLTQQQWYQQNNQTQNDVKKSANTEGETPPTQAPKKYDGSEIVIPPIHTTSAQCVSKMKPLTSKTETIPKIYKKGTKPKLNTPKPQVNESNKPSFVEMPQDLEMRKERKLVSKPLQAILQTINEVKESERMVRERSTFTVSKEQPLERSKIQIKEKAKAALPQDLEAQSSHINTKHEDAISAKYTEIARSKEYLHTIAQESLKPEVLEASQSTTETYSNDPNRVALQQSTTFPNTDDADILAKTYSAPTHEKIQCNIPATIGPLPVFKTSKDMPLSVLLKTVRLRNRLETCRAFLESIQMENPVQMGKCPSTQPPCPPKAPKCPPPDPCKKKPTPPKCPPPPVCPPPKPKCPPPPKKNPCCKCVGADPVAIADNMTKKSVLKSLPVLVVTLNHNGLCKRTKSDSDLEFLGIDIETAEDIILARSFEPWTPIPSWPVPTKPRKKLLLCPKDGCPIQPPPKDGDFCKPKQKPCKGFPKRVTFSDPNMANMY